MSAPRYAALPEAHGQAPVAWDEPSQKFMAMHAYDSAERIVPVTKADANLADGPCRGLLVGTAGTANIQDGSGTTRANVPLQAGYNPLVVKQVRLGGTAADIWALY